MLTLFKVMGYVGAVAAIVPAALKPVPFTTKTEPCAMLGVYATPSTTAVIVGCAIAAVDSASRARLLFIVLSVLLKNRWF
jgi:hypothetical protein